MAKTVELDLDNMPVEEMLALSKKLADRAAQASQKMFDDTIVFLGEKLEKMGRSRKDAALALYEDMKMVEKQEFKEALGFNTEAAEPVEKRTRAPRGSGPAKKPRKDLDSTGAGPEIGVTYTLNGLDWTKAGKLGATKKEFVEAILGGKTWAELKK